MKNILHPVKNADGLAGFVSAALGAIGLSQIPQYAAQYTQRLGGYVDGLKDIVEKTPEIQSKFETMSQSLDAINNSNILNRLYVFASNLDYDIATKAFGDYSIGMPISLEGAVSAGFGFLAGWGIYEGVKKAIKKTGSLNDS